MSARALTLHRRRCNLVVWSTEWVVTETGWPLYWEPREQRTWVSWKRTDDARFWLPLSDLVGFWDWFTGTIGGYKVVYGYKGNMIFPKVIEAYRLPTYDNLQLISGVTPTWDPDSHT